MNYAEAKKAKDDLYATVNTAGAALAEFDKYGKGAMGLTPDNVRAMPEYRAAKRRFDVAFNALRKFNGRFNKLYRRDILEERRSRSDAMPGSPQ